MKFSLDHIGILVPDLVRASALFESLGFRLTRRAEHQSRGPDGVMKSAGSAQRSIMFGEGYIELQALDEEGRRSHLLAAAARRYHGIHIAALGTDDAEAAQHVIGGNGVAVSDVLDWSRPIDEAGARGEARFRFFTASYGAEDEAFLCWVEHQTPELLRPPGLTEHPNGAVALTGFVIAAEHGVAALARRYQRFGGRIASGGDMRASIEFKPGGIEILSRTALPPPVAAARWPAPAWIAAMNLQFADLGDFRLRCEKTGISVVKTGGGLLVDLTGEAGCWMMARQGS